MRIVRVTETAPAGGRQFKLHHLTDLHVGAPDFGESEFRARVQMIRDDPWARWTMGGDGGDLIRHNDRRYSPTELAPRYRMATDIRLATREHLAELFDPIRDKCWGWADGNHERKMDEVFGGKFGVEVCCDLGIENRYVGYRGLINVSFQLTKTQRVPQLIDLQHGWQTGRLKGAFLIQMERELGMTEADIILRGHNHQPNGHVFVTLGVNQSVTRTVKRPRTVLNGGSWRSGYRDDLAPVNPSRMSEVEGDLWGETKGFRAEPVGGPLLIISLTSGGGSGARSQTDLSYQADVAHTLVKGEILKDAA